MFACAASGDRVAIRAPLILQDHSRFDAATIASAFLVSPSTMGQRLVRAKSKIREAGIPFRVPEREELHARLDAVLAAIYAAFAEGWSDPAGTEFAGATWPMRVSGSAGSSPRSCPMRLKPSGSWR